MCSDRRVSRMQKGRFLQCFPLIMCVLVALSSGCDRTEPEAVGGSGANGPPAHTVVLPEDLARVFRECGLRPPRFVESCWATNIYYFRFNVWLVRLHFPIDEIPYVRGSPALSGLASRTDRLLVEEAEGTPLWWDPNILVSFESWSWPISRGASASLAIGHSDEESAVLFLERY